MSDPSLLAYVEAIEAALGRRLGREHLLSPPDFALARAWHRAEVSISNVLAGIDEAFASGLEPHSLGLCRRFVERLKGS